MAPLISDFSAHARDKENYRLSQKIAEMKLQLLDRDAELRREKAAHRSDVELLEAWLREREERFGILVNALQDSVLTFDECGRCTGAYGGDGTKLIMTPASWLRFSLKPVESAIADTDFERNLRTALAGKSAEYECDSEHLEGGRLLVRLAPLRTRNGAIQGALGLLRDITEQRRLEREIIEISSSEQERIGQDLHDDLGQQLTGIALMLGSVNRKILDGQLPDHSTIETSLRFLNEAISHTRSLAKGLSTVDLGSEGFHGALREIASTVSSYGKVTCRLEWSGEHISLDTDKTRNLFRIAQEAINNALKHAEAKSILLRVLVSDHHLELRIEDDGCGMPSHGAKADGIGMRVMAIRARVLNGEFEISPRKDGGTVVFCRIRSG